MGVHILVVHALHRRPLVGALVKNVLHVVGLVAAEFQRARNGVALAIVDGIQTHSVTVHEALGRGLRRNLGDRSIQVNRNKVSVRKRLEHRLFRTTEEQRGRHWNNQILFHPLFWFVVNNQ